MESELLQLLMQSEPIRKHFFTEKFDNVLIFDKKKFQEFVSNKAFLPDSYTSFKNRIGLTDGRSYLSENRNIVLAWPYKDCVLRGGMSSQDDYRDEVFLNITLAPDDISRLFEPKVMTGFERWDAKAVTAGQPSPIHDVADEKPADQRK